MTSFHRAVEAAWRWAQRYWALRTLEAGAASTLVDVAVLISLVRLAHLDPVPAAASGVAAGATVNFILSRRYAFRDSRGKLSTELWRYVLGMAVAIAIHASLVYALADRLHVYYVAAKLIADVLVFGLGNLFLLRVIVFPRFHRRAA
ncbi:MAG TPA: GtrA family protein [Myxococcales bacterium]|nr:GtrA family protein [Myxococcales bacterium]